MNHIDKALRKEKKKHNPKYEYPENVVTPSMLKQLSKYGVDYRIDEKDTFFVRSLDAQRKKKKRIFGGGYLISEKAAAEKAAAEKWELSEREKEIIKNLGK